jgi:hypothetical protein
MTHLARALAIATVLAAAPAGAADGIVRMQPRPELAKDLAAFPRIAAPVDAAASRINVAVGRLDVTVHKAVTDCRKQGGAQAWWERTVAVTMPGPHFLSYRATDNVFCGGAHPNVGTMAIVYDLATGAPVDWTKLLPPALTGTVSLAEEMDGTKMVRLASKRLHALYLARYRPRSGNAKADAEDDECREAVAQSDAGPPAMIVWLDATEGGLALSFDLPHVVQACADEVVISAADLRREGAAPDLVDAIEKAYATAPKR